MITTQKDLRAAFLEAHPNFQRRGRAPQNSYPANVRMAWCDFVEAMRRCDEISEALAGRATL